MSKPTRNKPRPPRPSLPLPGPARPVSLAWHGPTPDVERGSTDTEILLMRATSGTVMARIKDTTATVTGFTPRDQRALAEVLAHPGDRVAMVLNVDDSKTASTIRVDVNVHVYARRGGIQPSLSIAVGNRGLRSVRLAAGDEVRSRDPQRALAWLSKRLVLPALPVPGGGAGPGAVVVKRIVVSAGPREDPAQPIGFRIHGRGLAVDVKAVGDLAILQRVVSRAPDQAHGPLTLVYGEVDLKLDTDAARLSEGMRQRLAQLAAGEGFLAMWHQYNRAESWWVQRSVRDAGYVRYAGVTPTATGHGFQFMVTDAPRGTDAGETLLERAARALDQGEPLELEAGDSLPTIVMPGRDADPASWELLDEQLPDNTVRGEVVDVDAPGRSIHLRIQPPDTPGTGYELPRPPRDGFLYLAFRGDRRRMLRRRSAFQRVLAGRTAIGNLLALIEGEPASGEPPRQIKPASEAAWASFKRGKPTAKQVAALDVALNTPDIAIIQGPPGTGKTQVIAALQTRLAEDGRSFARLRGSMLLTSYQHAAVDELVERSEVLGLPANKVDRQGRGTTVHIDQWREESVHLVSGRIRASEHGTALAALQRVAALAAGYLLAPVATGELADRLGEIAELVEDLVPGRLVDQLHTCLATQRVRVDAPASRSDAHELAVRAVRGLRTTADGFADDGPAGAAKALRRLRALDAVRVPEGALATLARAADWREPDPPPFLAELAGVRASMLDLLAGPAGPNPEPMVDPAIQSVLEEVVAALEDRTAGQPDDGVALALLDYRNVLEGDPEAVTWTLREYTASYAATCQQVASPGMRDAKLEDRIDDILFDTVIVDEAARANPLDLMIPLNHAARRIVLVGDHKQLPHMLEPDVERELDADIRDLLDQSMFERLFTKLGKPDAPVRRVVTLDTQFRMHPVLGSFVSRNFYDNGLESGLPDTEFAHGLRRFGTAVAAWLAVGADQGVEQGDRSKFRPAEAQVIADELADLVTDAPQLTFGVISFYAAQVQEIWQALAHPDRRLAERTSRGYRPVERLRHDQAGNRLDRLHVGTVDAFQGREFDVVFLSVTRSARPAALERRPNPSDVDKHRRWVARCYGHLTLINRLCVAMSRQKRLLIAVGDPAMCEPATAPAQVAPLADFLRLCGGGAPHGYLG